MVMPPAIRNAWYRIHFLLTVTAKVILPPFYSFARLERHCIHWLREHPDANFARVFLADFYKAHRRYREARAQFEELSRMGYERKATERKIGEASYCLKDYAEAVKHLNRVIEDYRHDPVFNYYLGASYLYQDRYAEALPRLLEARPEPGVSCGPLWDSIGLCFSKLGDPSKAAEYYDKAATAEPTSAEIRDHASRAHAHLANWYLSAGDNRQAVRHLRRGLEFATDVETLEEIRRTLRKLGVDTDGGGLA
jgi:tetratricopeptide (TPR) repeat protein